MASNTTPRENRILEQCIKFGGFAEECAQIAESLDDELSNALSKIEELEGSIQRLETELEAVRNA